MKFRWPSLPRPRLVAFLLVGSGVSFAVVLLMGFSYVVSRNAAIAADQEHARSEARRAAQAIEAEVSRLPTIVNALADEIGRNGLSRDQLHERLREKLDVTPQLFGLGVGYAPHAFDPELRLYAPYVRRNGDSSALVQLDSQYDYTQAENAWYQRALSHGAGWLEPAVLDMANGAAVEYAAPFTSGVARAGTAKAAGVVHGTLALAEIDELIRSLDLGEVGYGFLVSSDGFVISHPFAAEFTSGPAPAVDRGDPTRSKIQRLLDAARASDGEHLEKADDPVTGEPSWIFSERVPSTGWTVGVVFFEEQAGAVRRFRREQMRVSLAAVICLLFVIATALAFTFHGRVPVLWLGVAACCGVLIVGIGAFWFQGYGAPPPVREAETVFVNAATLRNFVLETTRTSLRRRGALPHYVPTGIFLQTLQLTGPNNVAISGYIWQTYESTIPADVARGFLLPEAAELETQETYRQKVGTAEVIGWYVRAVIRQSFDYTKYPLDQQNFGVRIWHRDLERGVILVPDLSAYQIIHPLAKPGLEKEFTLPGWEVERAQFSSQARSRNTTFGIAQQGSEAFNELRFNVVLNRRILEPVFVTLLPLAIAGFMVFTLLVVVKESTRVNVVQTLAAHSGLVFVVILSELDMRRRLESSTFVYIEYFYFVTYGAILAAALITIINFYHGYLPRLEQREHLLPKLLFWPVVLGTLLVITVGVFY